MLLGALSLSRGATAQCTSTQPWCSAFTPVPAPGGVLGALCTLSPTCQTRPLDWQVERVLEQHNLYREKHGACPMTYSTAIEDYVMTSPAFQDICNTGSLKHNTGNSYGENIAMVGTSGATNIGLWDAAEAVKNWYCLEENCYDGAFWSQILRFSQVVWKDSLQIGCGLCSVDTRMYIMCNYHVKGNHVSQFGSQVGAPGSTATGCAVPTAVPTFVPTAQPTSVPTAVPTSVPTAIPRAVPTTVPTSMPTAVPTAVPTSVPTAQPTSMPTAQPTAIPTSVPTATPTAQPTAVPPFMPTAVPTSAPSTCTDKDTIKTTCPRSLPDTCRFKVQHQERVLSVAFSSDGTHFATGSDDGVRVFEIATGMQTLKLACADFAVHDVVFSPDALSVAVAGAGGRAVVCDVATGALRYVLHNLGSKSTPIRKVAYSRVGGLLAGGGGNAPSTRVVRADDGALDLVIHAHARNVAFSPDGSLLATVVGSEVDEIVQIWDVATGAKVGTVVSEGARVVSVAFLSGGELLRGMDSGAVLMTRWASGTVGVGVATVSAAVSMPSHVLHHATPSADGQLFAAAGPAEVVVWTAAGTVHTRLAGLDSIVAQVSFSPDSSLLATAGHDGSLLVWSLV